MNERICGAIPVREVQDKKELDELKYTSEEFVEKAGKEIEDLRGVAFGERQSEGNDDLEAIEWRRIVAALTSLTRHASKMMERLGYGT